MKNQNGNLPVIKSKTIFAIGLTFITLMGISNLTFNGRVLAKLTFTPISWLHGLSHRNLRRDDFTDYLFMFFYILCAIAIWKKDQKALGLASSQAVSKAG